MSRKKDDVIKEYYHLMVLKYKALIIVKRMINMIKICEICQWKNDIKRRKEIVPARNLFSKSCIWFHSFGLSYSFVADNRYSRFIWKKKIIIRWKIGDLIAWKDNGAMSNKVKKLKAEKALVFKAKKLVVI